LSLPVDPLRLDRGRQQQLHFQRPVANRKRRQEPKRQFVFSVPETFSDTFSGSTFSDSFSGCADGGSLVNYLGSYLVKKG
jgi:hypothetical protein